MTSRRAAAVSYVSAEFVFDLGRERREERGAIDRWQKIYIEDDDDDECALAMRLCGH